MGIIPPWHGRANKAGFISILLLGNAVLSLGLMTHGANAGAESRIRQGMNYMPVRKSLLENGFQAVQPRWEDKQDSCKYNPLCDLPETQWCLSTGTGHCQMKFMNINRRRLVLEVSGGRDPKVLHFYFE